MVGHDAVMQVNPRVIRAFFLLTSKLSRVLRRHVLRHNHSLLRRAIVEQLGFGHFKL